MIYRVYLIHQNFRYCGISNPSRLKILWENLNHLIRSFFARLLSFFLCLLRLDIDETLFQEQPSGTASMHLINHVCTLVHVCWEHASALCRAECVARCSPNTLSAIITDCSLFKSVLWVA